MINSTSPSDRVLRPDGVVHHTPTPPDRGPKPDRFSPENTAALQTALQNQPAIRPEVVARARALAADPAYPSTQILSQVSKIILGSPDLSEQAD
jgi:hypothetical protein